MKNKLSLFALIISLLILLTYRFIYFESNPKNGYNATSWDAFGYYMYLPSTLIYQDVKELKWIANVDSTYQVTGGHLYQAIKLENGNYTNKYFCGVSIMEIPYFYVGHLLAKITNSPQDGFSWPYQYSILFGAIFWVFLGLIFLRKILLHFFSDETTALTIFGLVFCSNLIQYVSIDGAMSHAFIFPLYAFIIWATIRWHESFQLKYAILIGLICGLATISRPTELIMIFIPILWNTHSKEARKAKWKAVFEHKLQLLACVLAGVIAISPQLIYWKYTTGHFVFDVGSKWYFFNPWFRVLFGPEKGWFLYTPISILMVLGLLLMKGKNFKRSILTFCILNIWIIIAWSDWKYGASYSARAFVQSYPVFAIPLALAIENLKMKKLKIYLILCLVILFGLNIYQINIYNKGILEDFSPILKLF